MSFELSTPRYRLAASGVRKRIVPKSWTGREVATAVSEALSGAAAHQGPPVVVGAIPFDPSSPALLYMPEEVTWSEGHTKVPSSDPAPANRVYVENEDSPAYRSAVAEAVNCVRTGWVDKVVLARRRTVGSDEPFDPDLVSRRLIARNQNAYVYRLDLPGHSADETGVLLGASPELVLASRAGAVHSFPLAGSAPRGPHQGADRTAARALLASAKDLDEHRHVALSVRDAFRLFAEDVVCPATPELVRTPAIWHLGTSITGRLRDGVSPMELLYALHPTPAVCGTPTERAKELIRRLEGFDRGLYAGLIGWIDAEGNGEWALILRGGVLEGNRAVLTAGAGIVAASDPQSEHEETAVKFSTFMSALGTVDKLVTTGE